MAQVLIRNLDDELVEDYRDAAKRNDRSLEAELRELLRSMRPVKRKSREELVEIARRIRAMTPNVPQTPSEDIVRTMRDGLADQVGPGLAKRLCLP